MRSLRVAALLPLLLLPVGPPAAARTGWSWPVGGKVITPYRNGSNPYAGGQHRGIDIAAPVGTPARAATNGTVRYAGRVGWSGLVVSIRTAGARYDTSYLHLSSLAVRRGERVRLGQRLGAVGTTGHRSARRPHLHFGVRDAGTRRYHDPLEFLPPLAGPRGEPARPRGAPLPVPVGPRPLATPESLAHRRSRPLRLPEGRRLPVPAPTPRGVPTSSPRPIPDLGPAPRGAPLADPRPAPVPARGGRAEPSGGFEPDAGLALACLGLLLAAALLGVSGQSRARAARGRARVAAALRPLLGRG
jgi:Peptidase family M23